MAGHKIFVSYNRDDRDVKPLYPGSDGTRAYEEELRTVFINQDMAENLAYKRGNPADMTEEEILSRLDSEMAGCDVTVLLITPNMMDPSVPERDQWVPWEMKYAMDPQARSDKSSIRHAVIGVVVPDSKGSYNHTFRPGSNREFTTDGMFKIVRGNVMNLKEPKTNMAGEVITTEESSYICMIKWSYFHANADNYLNFAIQHRNSESLYNLDTEVE